MTYIKKGYNPWNKGKKLSEEIKQKMRGRIPINKGKKGLQVAWNKGLKTPLETRIKQRKKKLKSGYTNKRGYKILRIFSKHILEHHLVWLKANQLHRVPEDSVIHHIDLNPSNNNINNLQLMSGEFHTKLHWNYEKLNNIRRKY